MTEHPHLPILSRPQIRQFKRWGYEAARRAHSPPHPTAQVPSVPVVFPVTAMASIAIPGILIRCHRRLSPRPLTRSASAKREQTLRLCPSACVQVNVQNYTPSVPQAETAHSHLHCSHSSPYLSLACVPSMPLLCSVHSSKDSSGLY